MCYAYESVGMVSLNMMELNVYLSSPQHGNVTCLNADTWSIDKFVSPSMLAVRIEDV